MKLTGNADWARLLIFNCRFYLVTNGEGPRSGGGVAPSGAGAKRKEGGHPPDNAAFVLEAVV